MPARRPSVGGSGFHPNSQRPFLSLEFLRHLAARVEGRDVAVPRTRDGLHPLRVAYAHTVRPSTERQPSWVILALTMRFASTESVTAAPREKATIAGAAARASIVRGRVRGDAPSIDTVLRTVELGPNDLARFDPDGLILSNVNTWHDSRQACSRTLNR
jgi:hypothetical protein